MPKTLAQQINQIWRKVMAERIGQIHKDAYESCGMPRARIEQGVWVGRLRLACLKRNSSLDNKSSDKACALYDHLSLPQRADLD